MNAHTRFLEQNLMPAIAEEGTKPFSLKARMRAYGVPGVSVAVIHDGKLQWARGWGVRSVQTCMPVTTETDFQAASISKVITALTALRLSQRGKIDLDTDVNNYLTSWKLPADATLAPRSVTLRELLSHTAGLNVHGFPGYPAGTSIPTPVEVLRGASPAVTDAVKVVLPVGQQWQYSGGGYVVTQVALGDVMKTPFAELARQEVLRPLGMRRSAFAQPPSPAILANAAVGHEDGKPIEGGYHIYPELGPAGLWTTPSDLALLLMDIQASARGQRSKLLSAASTQEMLRPVIGDWGLGPALFGTGPTRRFGHDGVNEGFQSAMVAYVERGEGVVVMTNGAGKRLADEIVRAVAADYGWTELAATPIVEMHLSSDALAQLSGGYEGSGMTAFLDLREGHLFAQTGGPNPERLIALTPDRFKTEISGMVIEFERDTNTRPLAFKIVEGGPPVRFARVADEAADPYAADLYLRGSMNDWGTSLPLEKAADGTLFVETPLDVGDFQFKFGAADWKAADVGGIGAAPIAGAVTELPAVSHGGNFFLRITEPGTYRFELKPTMGGRATFTLKPIAASRIRERQK